MSYQFSTTTPFSDETYLESFVESISGMPNASLPNEIRRNLDHLRDLDQASCKLLNDWRERQDGCLTGVEETLLEAFRGEAAAAAGDNSGGSDVPTPTEKKKTPVVKGGTKRKAASPEKSPSPRKRAACAKCRAKKVKCDGRQPYCLYNRSNKGGEEEDGSDDGDSDEGSEKETKVDEETQQKNDPEGGGKVPQQLTQNEVSAFLQKRGPPTNQEIKTALHARNPQYGSQREEITNMYHELRQFSNEKINTAKQLKSMVDMALGRLDRDLEKFEKELGIDQNVSGGGQGGLGGISMVADAAAGVTGAGVHTQCNYPSNAAASMATVQLVASSAPAQTTASNVQFNNSYRPSSSTSSAPPHLPPNTTSAMQQQQPYPSMRGAPPPPPKSVNATNLAAIQVPNSPDWILAKILSHDKSTKMYTLSDEDFHSNQIYTISEKQVVPLKGMERNKWARGDVVYAVYPDTTSFYHATVSTPPYNGFVMVQFKDDWDANGVTHEKAVLVQHVMKVPPGRK